MWLTFLLLQGRTWAESRNLGEARRAEMISLKARDATEGNKRKHTHTHFMIYIHIQIVELRTPAMP